MVIQRWQNLFLLCAAIMMALFSYCSLGQIQGADITVNVTALNMQVEGIGEIWKWNIPTFVMSVLSGLLALVALCRFKNLKAQRSIAWMGIMSVIATCACAWLACTYAGVEGAQRGMQWSVMAFAPFCAIIFYLLAIKQIKSDQKKLRSYDRLR